MNYDNKRGEKDPVINADKASDLAVAYGYHTTVFPWVEGDQQVRELLNLFGGEGESARVLRYCILRHYFRELEAEDWSQWGIRSRLARAHDDDPVDNVQTCIVWSCSCGTS